ERYWRYKGETWSVVSTAEPNPGHVALAELARDERIALLVTQNVDGLHERSGVPAHRLVDIHGSDATVVCVACGARAPRAGARRAWEPRRAVPRCAGGGPGRPATISFGQARVEDDLRRAFAAAAASDLLVAVGTPPVVGPINQLLPMAREAGARTAILTA